MEQPKITIITAAYNLIKEKRENSFRECLESVHNQTYRNIEHIIVYTPDSDGTKEIIDEYIRKGWVKCFEQPIKGIWQAMAKGLEVAGGDYINFMNSDDYFVTTKAVELIVDEIINNDLDYVYSDAISVNKNGTSFYWYGNIDYIPFGQCLCHQTMFVNTNVMKELGGFDFDYKLSLDNYFMLKLLLNNKKSAYIKQSLVNFRQGGWSSKQDLVAFKKEYAENFYNQIGKDFNMTLNECEELWCFNVIDKKSRSYCLKLAKKIKIESWRKVFLNKIEENKKNKLRLMFSILRYTYF